MALQVARKALDVMIILFLGLVYVVQLSTATVANGIATAVSVVVPWFRRTRKPPVTARGPSSPATVPEPEDSDRL